MFGAAENCPYCAYKEAEKQTIAKNLMTDTLPP
jgi:hypothetical protein